MGNHPGTPLWPRLRRFALLNPCFLLALLAAAAAGRWGWSERPRFPLRPDRVTGVVGRVSGSPQCGEGFSYFELRPESIRQSGGLVRLSGRIAVHLRSLGPDLCSGLDPPLSYGDRIRLRVVVTEPSHFAVPGVPDYRDIQWLHGIAASVRLKSASQIERLHDPSPGPSLGPLFRYAEDFRRFCREAFTPSQYRVILSVFLGEKRILEAPERERIRGLGAFHLFVVSGFHVSLVLGVFHYLFRRMGAVGRLVGLAAMWGYVAVTGAGPAALRAGFMTSLFYVYLSAGVGRSVLNCLGLTALGMLAVSPGLVYEAGFQFSFLALLAISLFALHWRGWSVSVQNGFADVWGRRVSVSPGERLRRRIRFCLEEKLEFLPRRGIRPVCRAVGAALGFTLALLTCNVLIQAVTLPLGLFYSNRLVWTQDFSNLVLTPLFCGFVPLCLLLFGAFKTVLSGAVVVLASLYADGLALAMSSLERLSSTIWWRHPGFPLTLTYLVALAATIQLLRGSRRWLLVVIPALLLIVARGSGTSGGGWLQVTMLDVGQGESIHLRYPNGDSALVDTGGLRSPDGSPSSFVGERLVGRYLWQEGVSGLRFVLLSHPHVDHIQGFQFLRRVFPVGSLLFHEYHESYRGARLVPVSGGDSILLGGVEHRILHPRGDSSAWGVNDASVVMRLRFGRFSMLFTGDMERKAERALLPKLEPVTVLKVPHHGGAGGCSRSLLEVLRPRAVLISAGRRNAFGHPSPETLRRLIAADVPVFTTATSGTLRIETDGVVWRLSGYSSKIGGFRRYLQQRL